MKHGLHLLPLMLLSLSSPLLSAEKCSVDRVNGAQQPLAAWIDQDNWLAPENLHFGMQSAGRFLPLIRIKSPVAHESLRVMPKQLELDKVKADDPLDQAQRGIGFLLDTRLYADGFLVLRNGKVLSETYWHGLSPQEPRLLLDGTRPILSLLGAIAVAQGNITPDKSVIRLVPALSAQTGLRKLSLQRLLDANSRFEWSVQEINDWQAAGGWRSGSAEHDIRGWLNQADRWERKMADAGSESSEAGPDGDLLTWALAEAYHQPLAQVFCENVLGKLRPENPVFWATDQQGTELSNGLALSLRDFARFGQMLIEARSGAARGKLPAWFIETLSASRGHRKSDLPELAGLKKGSEYRYGFVHLGGDPNRIAIIGPYGNSLYIDFDRRLVIAVLSSYPKTYSASARATLEQVWDAVRSATQPGKKR